MFISLRTINTVERAKQSIIMQTSSLRTSLVVLRRSDVVRSSIRNRQFHVTAFRRGGMTPPLPPFQQIPPPRKSVRIIIRESGIPKCSFVLAIGRRAIIIRRPTERTSPILNKGSYRCTVAYGCGYVEDLFAFIPLYGIVHPDSKFSLPFMFRESSL